MARDNLATALTTSCRTLDISLPEAVAAPLLAYLALLIKWNKTYNLVGHAAPLTLLNRHLVDAQVLHAYLASRAPAEGIARLMDVGSGAGLPGIVLAINAPQCAVTLCEPREKRCLFLFEVIRALGLNNVTLAQTRVEALTGTPPFDVITCRAFAKLTDFIQVSAHCLAPGGVFVAMKGAGVSDELDALPGGLACIDRHAYQLPGIDGERWLVSIQATEHMLHNPSR